MRFRQYAIWFDNILKVCCLLRHVFLNLSTKCRFSKCGFLSQTAEKRSRFFSFFFIFTLDWVRYSYQIDPLSNSQFSIKTHYVVTPIISMIEQKDLQILNNLQKWYRIQRLVVTFIQLIIAVYKFISLQNVNKYSPISKDRIPCEKRQQNKEKNKISGLEIIFCYCLFTMINDMRILPVILSCARSEQRLFGNKNQLYCSSTIQSLKNVSFK